jgi:hypothetical protein
MAQVKLFADLLQELRSGKKSGALYISIAEKSEDMARFYFNNGELYHVRYGTAVGNDCLDIMEFYTMKSATFYEDITAPDTPAKDMPATDDIISRFRKSGQSIKAR